MWGTVMAINSFVIWPIAFIFLIYSIGRAVLFFEWKMMVLAIIMFSASIAAQMVVAVISESGSH